jgi:protein-S-isoprenylcysteine O-methyltransferase Ste14
MLTLTLQIVAWTAVMAIVLLWPAGTLAYPGGWAFIVLFAAAGSAISFWLYRHNPRLLRERMASPIQREQKSWDRAFLSALILAFFGWMAFMARDASRSNFAAVPVLLQVAGGVAVGVGFLGGWLAFRENTFAAPVVKIQEGQTPIDTGVYGIVRHPMYAGAIVYLIGMPLLLGSWQGLWLTPILILALAWRIVREERTLRAELPSGVARVARGAGAAPSDLVDAPGRCERALDRAGHRWRAVDPDRQGRGYCQRRHRQRHDTAHSAWLRASSRCTP